MTFAGLGEIAASIILHHYFACAEQALADRILTYLGEDGVLHKLQDDEVIMSMHTVARSLGFTLEEVAV